MVQCLLLWLTLVMVHHWSTIVCPVEHNTRKLHVQNVVPRWKELDLRLFVLVTYSQDWLKSSLNSRGSPKQDYLLYLNNKDSNENRTQNDSVEAGVTEVTVKNRIKEFLSLLEKVWTLSMEIMWYVFKKLKR